MWTRRPHWTWTQDEHQQAFEAHMRAQGRQLHREMEAQRHYDAQYLLPPGGKGYGHSTQWPFDAERAKRNPGYSRGINRAIENEMFHPAWRLAAWDLMQSTVVPYVHTLAQELEAAHVLHALHRS
jgi:hypothetical protein